MSRILSTLAILSGLLPVSAALAALLGLGITRGLSAGSLSTTTAVLVLLPIAGLWSMFARRTAALPVAMWMWPALLLFGLPGYFPGEVPSALVTGYAVLAAPGGRELTAQLARIGNRLATPVNALPQGNVPPPDAERPPPDCPPAGVATTGDAVALPYEGKGHSLAVPVQFGNVELPMLFDTGASVTTLNAESLRKIGVRIPADAPALTLRTANGERTARLVLIPQVWIGGLLVEGVTVGVCEECADERTSGLLGLNVSGQFLVTLDTVRKEVVFQVRDGAPDRMVDVHPWLDISANASMFPDERVEVVVAVENNASRPVQTAAIGIHCGDEHFIVRMEEIEPGEHQEQATALPRGTPCEQYQVTLDNATW